MDVCEVRILTQKLYIYGFGPTCQRLKRVWRVCGCGYQFLIPATVPMHVGISLDLYPHPLGLISAGMRIFATQPYARLT